MEECLRFEPAKHKTTTNWAWKRQEKFVASNAIAVVNCLTVNSENNSSKATIGNLWQLVQIDQLPYDCFMMDEMNSKFLRILMLTKGEAVQCSSASQLSNGEMQRVDLYKRSCNGTFVNTKSILRGNRKNVVNRIEDFINIKSIEQCPPWSSAFFWTRCRLEKKASPSIHPSERCGMWIEK